MANSVHTSDDLSKIADEVIDLLRPKGLTFADVRDVLKFVDENLEFELLGERT